MNILITGHCGFIGSNIARALAKAGHSLYGIDNLSTGKLENIKGIDFATSLENVSITDDRVADFFTSIPKIDAIIHLAANASIEKSNDLPEKDIESNLVGTVKMLHYAKKYGIKKFCQASSMVTYGGQPIPFKVNDKCEPKSMYGITKFAAERYVVEFCTQNNIDYTAFRMFNVYGPNQDLNNPYQGVAAIFIGKALKNESIIINGDGSQLRDFIFIDDVVGAWLQSLMDKDYSNKIINIGYGKGTSIKELAELIIEKSQSESKLVFREARTGEQKDSIASLDFEKWKPSYSLNDGLEITLKWARSTNER